jgi:hypothetical protein
MSLINTRVSVEVSGTLVKATDLGQLEAPFPLTVAMSFLNGTGAGQADQVYFKTRTLAASANEDLDVATGGGLTDAAGTAIAMARIKALVVYAAPSNTNNVNVTRPASNGVPWALAAGDGVGVAPGECKVLVARNDATAIAVTAATADLISFANSAAGSAVTYTVVIIGSSA